MASLRWAGACPNGIRARSREASAQAWDFQEGRSLPTTMRAQAPGPIPKETVMRFYNPRILLLERRLSQSPLRNVRWQTLNTCLCNPLGMTPAS